MRQSAPLPLNDAVQRPDTWTDGSPTVVLARLALATSHPGLLESLHGFKVARMATAARLTTLAESLSTSQASSLLCVNTSTVGRRRKRGMLHGFLHPRGWRYPTWQFAGGTTIPGLASILGAIPADLSAVSVRALMLAPCPGLADGSKRISPPGMVARRRRPRPGCHTLRRLSPQNHRTFRTRRRSTHRRRNSGTGEPVRSVAVNTRHLPGRNVLGNGPHHFHTSRNMGATAGTGISTVPLRLSERADLRPLPRLGSRGLGHIDVADETYGSGATWHRTSIILSISDEGIQDDSRSETDHVNAARLLPNVPLDENRTIL